MGQMPEEFSELAKTLADRLRLKRPIAFIDLETTGTNIHTARIVEIAVIKLMPDGTSDLTSRRVNPGSPIPAAATAVHGISDEDVRNEPKFRRLAASLAAHLEDCDLAGFGIARFDVRVLEAEFQRAGHSFSLQDRAVVDALAIFFEREPRDLAAALRFYRSRELEAAHTAIADVLASMEVLAGQFERYPDLPSELSSLDEIAAPRRPDPNWVDGNGLLVWLDNEIHVNFGIHKGSEPPPLSRTPRLWRDARPERSPGWPHDTRQSSASGRWS